LSPSSARDLSRDLKRWRASSCLPANYDAEGLGPPQPLKHRKTPSAGCRRLETPDCASQPESKSKKHKARSHRIDAPEGGQPTLSSQRQSEPRQAVVASSRRSAVFSCDADLAHVATTTPKMPAPMNAQTLTCLASLAVWRCCSLSVGPHRGSATWQFEHRVLEPACRGCIYR
jgi:hypothetical protein